MKWLGGDDHPAGRRVREGGSGDREPSDGGGGELKALLSGISTLQLEAAA